MPAGPRREIAEYTHVDEECILGRRVRIGRGCDIGPAAEIGDASDLPGNGWNLRT